MDDPRPGTWIRPALGEIRARLKNLEVDLAVELAGIVWERASVAFAGHQAELDLDEEVLAEGDAVLIRERPLRPSVLLTKLGSAFFEEGYLDVAKQFYQQAVITTPRGATRARLGMARVCLAQADNASAEQYAREALQMGKFQAKTLSIWPLLIAARVKQEKPALDEELYASLNHNQKGRVKARAILSIVKSLRGYGDKRWRDIAEEWIENEASVDEIIEVELAKILLAEEKVIGKDDRRIALAAHRILRSAQVSPKESLSVSKELVNLSLLGGENPAINALADKAGRIFGESQRAEVLHGMALAASSADRADLAETILVRQLSGSPKGSTQWGQDIWALATINAGTGEYSVAAPRFLAIARQPEIPLRFRSLGLLQWAENIMASGALLPAEELESELSLLVDSAFDYRTILDLARDFSKSSVPLDSVMNRLADIGGTKAREAFHAAATSSEKLAILIHLARREHYDLDRREQLLQFWDGLDAREQESLWSESEIYWELQSIIFMALVGSGRHQAAESHAVEVMEAPGTPALGLVHVGIALASYWITSKQSARAIEQFERIAAEHPTHQLVATAYYWIGLAHLIGHRNMPAIRNFLAVLRTARNTTMRRERLLVSKSREFLQQMGEEVPAPTDNVWTPTQSQLDDQISSDIFLLNS